MPHQTVSEARRANVQSTSVLLAQLTENLPQSLAINLTQNQRKAQQEKLKGNSFCERNFGANSVGIFLLMNNINFIHKAI